MLKVNDTSDYKEPLVCLEINLTYTLKFNFIYKWGQVSQVTKILMFKASTVLLAQSQLNLVLENLANGS